MRASTVIDIEALPLRDVEFDGEWLRIGALPRMREVASERRLCPFPLLAT
jgi:CO/xanthine dehydrogenase FAD-binding subunit